MRPYELTIMHSGKTLLFWLFRMYLWILLSMLNERSASHVLTGRKMYVTLMALMHSQFCRHNSSKASHRNDLYICISLRNVVSKPEIFLKSGVA